MRDHDTLSSVSYPCSQSLANTWNKELAQSMGECLADDAYERNVDILLGPGVNVKRHPCLTPLRILWGNQSLRFMKIRRTLGQ